MRRTFPIRAGAIVGLMAAVLLSGCGNNESTSSSDNTPPRVPDRAPAVSDSSKPGSDLTPESFLKAVANANMSEVQFGEVAKARAANPYVKQMGQHMIDDHSKNLEQVKQLAAKKNITLPSALNQEEQNKKAQFEKLSGPEFDQAYMKDMVEDHTKDVAEFEHAANSIKDPDVKSYVEQTLPTLRAHLKVAREVNDRVNATGSQASEKPGEQPLQTKKEPEPQPAR